MTSQGWKIGASSGCRGFFSRTASRGAGALEDHGLLTSAAGISPFSPSHRGILVITSCNLGDIKMEENSLSKTSSSTHTISLTNSY